MTKLPALKGQIATIAGAGLAALTAHPDLPADSRALGLIVIPSVAAICIAAQNIWGSPRDRAGAAPRPVGAADDQSSPRPR